MFASPIERVTWALQTQLRSNAPRVSLYGFRAFWRLFLRKHNVLKELWWWLELGAMEASCRCCAYAVRCYLLQVKSRTAASGRSASGDSRVRTSWRGTTASTRAPSPSSAPCASAPSRAATTSRCTWSATCPRRANDPRAGPPPHDRPARPRSRRTRTSRTTASYPARTAPFISNQCQC